METKSAGGHVSRFSHRCWKQRDWQSNTGLNTTATDRTRLFRGVRPWKSSSNGRRPDHPTSSHRNWTTDGGHVTVTVTVTAGSLPQQMQAQLTMLGPGPVLPEIDRLPGAEQ
jgi:hypothetical protein